MVRTTEALPIGCWRWAQCFLNVTLVGGDCCAEPSSYHGGCLASMSAQVCWATEARVRHEPQFSLDLGSYPEVQ